MVHRENLLMVPDPVPEADKSIDRPANDISPKNILREVLGKVPRPTLSPDS